MYGGVYMWLQIGPNIMISTTLLYYALVIFPCYVLYLVINLHPLVSNLQKCSELVCAVQGKSAVERQCSKWKVDCEELKAEVSSMSYTQYFLQGCCAYTYGKSALVSCRYVGRPLFGVNGLAT